MSTTPATTDLEHAIAALAIYSDATSRLAGIQAEIDEQILLVIDDRREEYGELQAAQAAAEKTVVTLAAQNRAGWFAKSKTVKTPYGQIRSTSTSSLDVPSEDSTLRLIRAAGRDVEFIRTVETLDKEAVEKLDDAELAKLGIARRRSESIKITPAGIDMGKRVEDAKKKAGKGKGAE